MASAGGASGVAGVAGVAGAGGFREWNLDAYLAELDAFHDGQLAGLLSHAEGRRLLTRSDPLLFAIVYLREHITPGDITDAVRGPITMSEAHLDFCKAAKEWVDNPARGLEPQASRHAYVCPRELGKTTWWYLIIPMWAAAHKHIRFIAAFADTAEQAQLHLSSFRRELDENELLLNDYKSLCTPAERAGTGRSVADRQFLYIADSGFIFSARGADTSVRGLKYGKLRPDLILLDDIEPDESKYSASLAEERKNALIDSVFPLNIRARVVVTGTTTMYGSIIHQMIRGDEWVVEQNIQVHHYRPIIEYLEQLDMGSPGADSEEYAALSAAGAWSGKVGELREGWVARTRSLWPAKWSLEWLLRVRNMRFFLKEYMNEPLSDDGIFWTRDLFIRGALPRWDLCILSVDPAVTSRDKSDFSAIAVIKYNARAKDAPHFEVAGAWHGKVTPEGLRERIIAELGSHPEVTAVLVEVNQGGDLWASAFSGLPVRILETTSKLPKPTRAAMALREYETGNVYHANSGAGLSDLEGEMCAFPGLNDDLVDAVSNGFVEILARANRGPRPVNAGRVAIGARRNS